MLNSKEKKSNNFYIFVFILCFTASFIAFVGANILNKYIEREYFSENDNTTLSQNSNGQKAVQAKNKNGADEKINKISENKNPKTKKIPPIESPSNNLGKDGSPSIQNPTGSRNELASLFKGLTESDVGSGSENTPTLDKSLIPDFNLKNGIPNNMSGILNDNKKMSQIKEVDKILNNKDGFMGLNSNKESIERAVKFFKLDKFSKISEADLKSFHLVLKKESILSGNKLEDFLKYNLLGYFFNKINDYSYEIISLSGEQIDYFLTENLNFSKLSKDRDVFTIKYKDEKAPQTAYSTFERVGSDKIDMKRYDGSIVHLDKMNIDKSDSYGEDAEVYVLKDAKGLEIVEAFVFNFKKGEIKNTVSGSSKYQLYKEFGAGDFFVINFNSRFIFGRVGTDRLYEVKAERIVGSFKKAQ